MTANVDSGTLATIGSIIAAFGAAMLFFRIQRELHMGSHGEIVWLPVADWLLISATLISLLFVIVPVAISIGLKMASFAAAAAAIMVAGYVLAILAHYRVICGRRFALWGARRTGPRSNPEPAELYFVVIAAVAALSLFMAGVAGFT